MHAYLCYDAITGVRRNVAIHKVKHAVAMHDYRAVFPQKQDYFFVYKVKEGSGFLVPYQISILNLFLLNRFNVLAMSESEGNEHIN